MNNENKIMTFPKVIIGFLIVFVLLGACSDQGAIPEDLEGKKTYLKTLKDEAKVLQESISEIEGQIALIEPPKEKQKVLVTTMPLVKKDFERFVDIQASVTSSDAVFASPELGGRLISMTLNEGDFVRRGQVIATLDMDGVKKQVSEVEKSLELATDIFNRQEKLWNQQIGSEVQFLQAKNNKERLEKSLETIKFQLTKSTVVAPISGYVDAVLTEQGEIAGPGTPIVQLINTNTVKIVADVPENYLSAIKKGKMVTLSFPALGVERQGRVSLIGRSIDPSNRTFKVEVKLANGNGMLKPNLLSIMKLNDLKIDDALAVPLVLVQQEVSGKDYIYVTSQENGETVSAKRYVVTGPSYEELIVIDQGLNEGDNLIVTGARGLADGELLEVEL